MTSGNVYERIAAAYQDIAAETFEKTGTVAGSGGGYKFIPIGQILNIVRRAHGKHGVIVVFGRPQYDPEQGEKRTSFDKTTKNNYGETRTTTWHYAIGHIDVRIFGESSDDYIETEVPFEVQDNSDKLTNKIITNAERCLYRTLYAIDEGGEDPESINEKNDDITIPAEKPIKRRLPKDDPFFSKPAQKEIEAKDDFVTGDKIVASDEIPSEAEMVSVISVKGAQAKYKDVVKNFKIEKGAKSNYDLSYNEKVELYTILMAIDESDKGAGA